MVCSQVYSQHPSHCKFSNVHQYRYGAFSNAEVHCREPETSKADWVGNTTPDGHFMSSKGYACLGYASITSPFKSSWIQRLIPPHNTSVEQAQPSDKFNEDNHCIDVLQTNWKENAGHLTTLGNQSKFPVYENSRRTKQDFFMSHQTYSGTYTPECVPNGFITMPFEAPNALPPEIQVSPKPLPIVESLLPGYSKKVAENQTSTETNMSHMLSRGMELANPMKQTVHYSADEKSRVSCSSTERLNSHSVVRAAGDLLALNSSQMVQRCVVPSQPSSEFSFNSIGAFTQSNMDLTYGGMQTGTNVRMHKFKAQTYGLSLDQLPSPKTISKTNGCNPNKHHSCAHDGSETLYARDGSFDGGWWPNLNIEKDEPLVPLHHGVNVAKQKVGISFSQHMLEQDLGSLHGSHEEQGGTSRSFSFHIENRLASELDYAKLVARKGQWPFGPSTLSNEDLVQSRWSEDNRARGVAEVTRPGLPCDNSFIFQETGVCKAGTAYIGRSQSAPVFGMEKLNESSSPRISENRDVSPYKAACIDIGGVFTGEMNAQALPGNSVDHESASHRISDNHDVSPDKAARIDIGGVFTGEVNAQALPDNSVDQAGQTLQGGHPLGLESNLMMEGVEELKSNSSYYHLQPSLLASLANYYNGLELGAHTELRKSTFP